MSGENAGTLGHWCAVLNTGVVKCAGTGDYGQLGNSASSASSWLTPVTVTGIANATKIYAISSGYSTDYGRTCALLSDTTVKCWGQLPSYGSTNTPIAITGLTGVTNFSMSQENGGTLGHWCAVLSDGTARCAGTNGYGQLGNNTTTSSSWITPVTVSGLAGASKILTASAGYSTAYGRSCALLSDTTVKCWGYLPSYGQTNVPVAITGLTGVTDFSMSQDNGGTLGHWCAILSDGTGRCAGTNDYGQLGNNTTTASSWLTPVTVTGLTGASKVYTASAGYSTTYASSCALMTDKSIKCWGYNGYGQLGDGTATQRNTPVSVTQGVVGVTNLMISSVSGNEGSAHICAVQSNGVVKCWGQGNYGQLGDGTVTAKSIPTTVIGITNAVKVYTASAGYSTNYGRSCALLSDTTVKCWGQLPSYGQLSTPVAITGLTGVTDFSMSQGNDGAVGHWCAVLSDGTGRCAGTGGYGQLGNGAATASSWLTPVTVSGLTGASRIFTASAGYSTDYGYSCSLLSNGWVRCWGYMRNGVWQQNTPVSYGNFGGTQIQIASASLSSGNSSGEWHSCYVGSGSTAGQVYCMGTNTYGQLGNGSTASSASPVTVGISNAVKVYTASSGYSTNYGRSCALLSDTTVKCWGQLPSYGQTSTPLVITGLSGVVDFSMSQENSSTQGHWCAVLNTWAVKCGGTGGYGQLWNGASTDANWISGAVTVSNTSNALKVYTVSAGYSTTYGYSCTLLSDGWVKCWGYMPNSAWQYNTPVSTFVSTQIQVQSASLSSGNSSGEWHSCYVGSGSIAGQVYCVWTGNYGQLGNGATSNSAYPVQVTGITNAVKVYAVSAGYSTPYGRSCALLADGTVKCWGQLPSYGQTSTPLAITGLSWVVDFSMSQGNSSQQGHWCAVLNTGAVKCAGTGDYGQLWNGASADANWISGAVSVASIANAVRVYTSSAGSSTDYGYSCALLQNGQTKCWGYNGTAGQLWFASSSNAVFNTPQTVTSGGGIYYNGIGSVTVDKTIPELKEWITAATAVSAGDYHGCAIEGGTVRCWGYNAEWQLGNNSTNNSTVPVWVFGLSTATQLASGYMHTCAILTDGTVKCWGLGKHGELGNGTQTSSTTPVTVSGVAGAVEISAGDYHTCAALTDGTVKCWGLNDKYQLGSNTGSLVMTTPQTVTGLSGVTRITSWEKHTCTVTGSGSVYCWWAGDWGQLGNWVYMDKQVTPTLVAGISTALRIWAGDYHTCAVLADTTMRCWGLNHMSQHASTAYYSTPNPTNLLGTTNVLNVVGGNMHTCLISTDLGNLNCFGGNVHGQLGIGTMNTTSNVALVTYPVNDTSGITNYTLALCETREAYSGNLGGIDGADALCKTQCGQWYKFIRESEMANFNVSAQTTNTYWIDRALTNGYNCQNWTDGNTSSSGSTVQFNYLTGTTNATSLSIPMSNGVSISAASCNNSRQLMCGRGIR